MRAEAARWVEPADDPCPHCLQGYALEYELRCVECDLPVCPICSVGVRFRHEVVCPRCQAARSGGG